MSPEVLAIGAGVYFALVTNQAFLSAALNGRSWASVSTWVFGAAVLVMLAALHALILGLVLNRWTAKPLLTLLLAAAAIATFYIDRYGAYIDPTMARNVLRTDVVEAGELIGWGLAGHLALYAAVPIGLVWWLRVKPRSWRRAALHRLATVLGAAALLVAALLLVFQDFAALMRNHKETRYLITPANAVYSFGRAMWTDASGVRAARAAVGPDAHLDAAWSARSRPVLFVIMVGETARAANWGLNGYARQTTPALAGRDVINFPDMSACGTNTETALPCMFSAIGRRDYDEDRIRNSDSLLNVLDRAGFTVLWRDNQSGCKGVCEGLQEERLDASPVPELCSEGRCLDEILLRGMDTVARDARGNLVVVLHMLGNHGPSYYKRYPPEFRRFTPTCDTGELRECTREQIVNAYDNALLYTDHVVTKTIDFLAAQSDRFDTGLIYVSDHGESLGEKGLYLHGIPYAIAPDEQIRIPMAWWLSPSFMANYGIDRECLARRASKPAAHDHLYHSVLGLLQVRTRSYERAFDLTADCRR